MQITLKNIKHSPSLSEETNAFTATVYIDGVNVGDVSNHGTGGCNMYHPWSLADRLNTYAKTLPPLVSTHGTFAQDADLLIDDVFTAWAETKDLTKLLKKHIVFLEDGQLLQVTIPTAAIMTRQLPIFAAKHGAATILNTLPLADALTLFRVHAQ